MAALEVDVGKLVEHAIRREFDARGPELKVLGDVWEERARQDEKWGEQNHPDLRPGLAHYLGLPADQAPDAVDVADYYGLPTATEAKTLTDTTAAEGNASWVAIATEELAEAVEAAASGDEDAVRAEVIQLAAVCVQWAQAIDRRGAAAVGDA
jgi:hypothetical protein